MNVKPGGEINDEDEPIPETLTQEIIQAQNIPPEKEEETPKKNSSPKIREIGSTPKSKKCHSKENSLVNPNTSLNVSKAYTTALPNNSLYENFDIQQLTYSIMKDYSQLRISKDENFMERMKFDIFKRQIKEERINKLVEQNKLKIDEEERVKAFNRLIEDANRRIEAQENLEAMKSKLEEDLITPPTKKYKEEEWDEIYKERFKKFQDEVTKKNEEKIKEKKEQERLKEEKEVELCKVKKAPKEVIEKASKRLYEESIKRRLKIESKGLSKVNLDNSPSKYKKTIRADYNFMSDNEDDNNKNNQGRNVNSNVKNLQMKNVIQNQKLKKNGPISVTEYNNKRFDICGKVSKEINNNKRENNNYKKDNQPIYNEYPNKNTYLEEYLEDEDEIREVPKPVHNTNNDWMNEEDQKRLEIAAIQRLKQNNPYQYSNENKNNNTNMNNNINTQIYQKNMISMQDSDACKIVDHFFTKNLKQS